jgi:hypothetical protein
LFLGIPIKWGFVNKVEDPCNRFPSSDVMHEIGV